MTDQTAESTLEAKHSFEHYSHTRGVEVQQYHADNGIFTDNLFKEDVKICMQRLTLCAVGAHHQNGIVERAIKSLTLISRTLLLHAQRHWPEYITTMLWPFALKAALDRMNQLHDNRLQSNPKGVPKWEPRARLGIYVGRSPNHAGNVALVLNPKTGLVSPQFHVVFDDEFTTVPYLRKGTVPPNWADLVMNSAERTTTELYDLTKTWFEAHSDETADEIILSPKSSAPSLTSVGAHASPNKGDLPLSTKDAISFEHEGNVSSHLPIITQSQDSKGDEMANLQMPPMVNLETAGLRRSPRLQKMNQKNGLSFTSMLTINENMCIWGNFIYLPGTINGVLHWTSRCQQFYPQM
ncbi:hypothetical protein ACHAXS_003067 [Conticribra weissflogii]